MKNFIKILLFLIAITLLASCSRRTLAGNNYSGEERTEAYAVNEIYPWLYSIEETSYNVYCYLLVGEKSALLFDTTFGYGSLHRVIREITELPVAVVLGHGHVDHSGGASQLIAYLHSDIWLHEADFDIYFSQNNHQDTIKKLNIGQVFDLGGLSVEVVGMEGHTAGSIGILAKEHRVLLTSDSSNPHIWLFLSESLPISQYAAMLERVIQLDFDTFFIGHGDEPMTKNDFQSFIKVARNASAEKSERHPDYASVFIYEEDGASVYFRDDSAEGTFAAAEEAENDLPVGSLGAFDLVLKDNFFYGNGYQALVRDQNLLNGYRLRKGDVYNLKVTYTASRDLENDLLVGFVDHVGSDWITLSYTQKNIDAPNVILGHASRAGEVVSSQVTISIIKSARISNPSANTLVLETEGQGRHRRRNSGVQGPVTLSFTEFVLTKVE